MRRIRGAILGVVAVSLLLLAPSAASALTLGSTTLPTGATAMPCTAAEFYVQLLAEPGTSYVVPTGGGSIASWSINTTGVTPGAPIALIVLRPSSGAGYTLVGFDTETVPNPAGSIATFPIASPIAVQAGDVLGLYSSTSEELNCYFDKGALSPSSVIAAGAASSLSIGGAYAWVESESRLTLNVSAELVQSEDAGVIGAVSPTAITAGGTADYLLSISNTGTASGPISLTDVVPSGVSVLSAVAGDGSCSVAGAVVKCTLSVSPGSKAPVSIAIAAPSIGTFTNTATVSGALPDPNAANNVATSVLTVVPPTPPSCNLIKLKGQSLALAKQLVTALGCKVGKVTKQASKSVHKGLVISTSPGAGTVPAGTAVKIVVSSGPPKKHAKHGKAKHGKK